MADKSSSQVQSQHANPPRSGDVEGLAIWSRTWTWQNDLSSSNGFHQSDISKRSPITLRSDGTGHFTALCDSNDTWKLFFTVQVPGQPDLPVPLYAQVGYSEITCGQWGRDFEFTWTYQSAATIPATLTAVSNIIMHGSI